MLERMGVKTGVDLDALLEVGRWIQTQLGRPVPGMLLKAGRFPKPVHNEAARATSLPFASNPKSQVRA